MLAVGFLLGVGLLLQFQHFVTLALELIVIAAPEADLLLVEMHDRTGRRVQKIAVVADDDDGVRIALHIVDQPQHAFKVEIVGRFVEEQQVRFGEKNCGQSDAHAPAAGKGGRRLALCFGVETETGQNGACASFRRMRIDIGKACMNFRNAVRVGCRVGLFKKCCALLVRLHDDFNQCVLGAGRFLRHLTDTRIFRKRDATCFRRKIARDHTKQRGFAGAVAANETGFRSRRQRYAGVVDQEASGNSYGDVVKDKHGESAFARLEAFPQVSTSVRRSGVRLRFAGIVRGRATERRYRAASMPRGSGRDDGSGD